MKNASENIAERNVNIVIRGMIEIEGDTQSGSEFIFFGSSNEQIN